MAAPHVAGAAALVAQANPSAGPATIAAAVRGSATTVLITNPGTNSPNLLLYSAPPASPAATPTPTPTASPTSTPSPAPRPRPARAGCSTDSSSYARPVTVAGPTLTAYLRQVRARAPVLGRSSADAAVLHPAATSMGAWIRPGRPIRRAARHGPVEGRLGARRRGADRSASSMTERRAGSSTTPSTARSVRRCRDRTGAMTSARPACI